MCELKNKKQKKIKLTEEQQKKILEFFRNTSIPRMRSSIEKRDN